MNISDVAVIFISILIEAVPFLILGSIVSAVIQEFVSEDFLRKIIPKNPILGSLVGVLMGFFIPTCDCAVIPVSARLIKKNVPLNVCISFMLAAPIVNPISLLSTIYAFKTSEPKMIIYRIAYGITVAIISGIVISFFTNKKEILSPKYNENDFSCACGCNFNTKGKNKKNNIWKIIDHSEEEFFNVMKYMLLGSLIASIMQVLMVRFNITTITDNTNFQTIIMMFFAYIISLCSTADAFVAKAFLHEVSNQALLAFLLLSPMMDIKNTLVLFQRFKKKFVIQLIFIIFIVIFVVTALFKV